MPRRFEYAAAVARDGRLLADGAAPLEAHASWTPEHLVLAGLMRCTLKSLAFHAERAGIAADGEAEADGVVTRAEDGSYRFVELDVRLDVTLDPPAANLSELLALAERDCFVGASLKARPRYGWRVNGSAVQ